ncbi:hypothetical protein AB0D38_44955, partial [Streptomyces sp. NPDC048279]|uniref:hypothetical protein n=1 Tax=Streptomyces sp. NPDC048279 TaxID=3154714 RepID=UPI0034315CDA
MGRRPPYAGDVGFVRRGRVQCQQACAVQRVPERGPHFQGARGTGERRPERTEERFAEAGESTGDRDGEDVVAADPVSGGEHGLAERGGG